MSRAAALFAFVGLALAAPFACSDTSGGTGSPSGSGSGDGGGPAASSTSFILSTSTVTTGTGGGPPACAAKVTNLPTGECDIYQQDCPVGSTCMPSPFNAPTTTACVAAPGLKRAGEDCMVTEECGPGLFCLNQCTPGCCSTTNDPCGGGTCNLNVDFGNSWFVVMCAYNRSCNLMTTDACPAGYGCHVTDKAQGLASCSTPSNGLTTEGGPCSYINDCPDEQECFTAGSTSTCRWYCFTDGRGAGSPGLGGCPAGRTCSSNSAIHLGISGVGLCL